MKLTPAFFPVMNILTSLDALKKYRKTLSNKTIGLVPTMGHLHQGHLSLCQKSQADNDITIVSIFVNPAQFNKKKDFKNYPRTIDEDLKLLKTQKIDAVFLPKIKAMYPDNYQVQVEEIQLSRVLEGRFRPGHVSGMLTIVLKLLNLVQATHAYFGEKDYQQLLLIKKMADAFFIPCKIIPCATLRASDKLALSSRNSRLTPSQRKKALHFPRLLHQKNISTKKITQELTKLGFKVDYVVDKWGRRLAAVCLDGIRLIDNVKSKVR